MSRPPRRAITVPVRTNGAQPISHLLCRYERGLRVIVAINWASV